MRKLAFFALAIVAVGCSTDPQGGSNEPAVPVIGDPGVTPAQVRSFEKLQVDTSRTWSWAQHESLNTPMHLAASRNAGQPILVKGKGAETVTLEFVGQYRDLFKIRDAAAELQVEKSEVDNLQMTHVRFQQVTHGVPVVGAELAAHYDAAGRITSVDANYIPGLNDVDLEPKITAKVGRDITMADVVARSKNADEAQLQSTDGKLVVFAGVGVGQDSAARPAALAYQYTVRAIYGSEPAIWVTTVDAKTGEIIDRYNNLQTVEATGNGVLGDSKKFQVAQNGGTYTMNDTTRGVTINTHTAGGQEIQPAQGARLMSSANLTSWDTGTGAGAAVDAHTYAGLVYDYYKKVHGRNAIDGAGGQMTSTAHFGTAYENAFWDGIGMTYGDGAQLFRPLSAGLDVVAHEFTHGVTEKTSNLTYRNQSGALNEAVSDIFGIFIEHSFKPDAVKNWKIGEDIAKGAVGLRDAINPAAGDQPANMKNFVNTQQDEGGVHINSGIINNAAYLMTVSGTNPVSQTKVPFGIGWEKSEKLWYRSNTKYFLASTNFAQAAVASMQAAKDIGLTENEQNIVDCAWKAVGIVQGACATNITDPKAVTPQTTPGGGTPTDGTDTTDGTGNSNGSTDETADEEEGSTTTTKKKPRTSSLAQNSSGCSVSAQGGTDLGPLAGLLAAVVGLALGRRKRK